MTWAPQTETGTVLSNWDTWSDHIKPKYVLINNWSHHFIRTLYILCNMYYQLQSFHFHLPNLECSDGLTASLSPSNLRIPLHFPYVCVPGPCCFYVCPGLDFILKIDCVTRKVTLKSQSQRSVHIRISRPFQPNGHPFLWLKYPPTIFEVLKWTTLKIQYISFNVRKFWDQWTVKILSFK